MHVKACSTMAVTVSSENDRVLSAVVAIHHAGVALTADLDLYPCAAAAARRPQTVQLVICITALSSLLK